MPRITVDGVDLNYADVGTGDVILLVHGYCMNHHLWDAQTAELAGRYRVISVDLPGHGASGILDPGFSFEDIGRLLVRLLDELGVQKFHLGGMSQGGFTVLRIALAEPDRVQSLALIATAPRAKVNDAFAGMVDGFRQGQRDNIIPTVVTLQMEPGTEERDPELIKKQIETINAEVSTESLIAFGDAVLKQTDVSGRLAEIKAPVIIIHGDADMGISVDEAREARPMFPNARLVEIPGGGHNINIQSAEQVSSALRTFYDDWETAHTDSTGNAVSSRVPVLPPTITYEPHGHIVVITINRPEALNALDIAMMAGIDAAFAAFNADPDLWVAIFTGAGDKSFCAGGDLDETISLLTGNQRDALIPDDSKRFFSDVFKPIITAVNGFCVAGGLEMLQGTDIRLAVPAAKFGLGEVRWGLVPGGGSHIRLPRQIPWAVAMEILLLGRSITAERAYQIGLVNEVVEPDRLLARAFELAEMLCSNGPIAVRTAKEIAVRAMNLEPGFILEGALSERVFATEDAKEGPKAFLEKRPPQYRNR